MRERERVRERKFTIAPFAYKPFFRRFVYVYCFAHSELIAVVCFCTLRMQSVHHIFLLCIEWLCSLLVVVFVFCTSWWRAAVNIPLENLHFTIIILNIYFTIFTQTNWPFQTQRVDSNNNNNIRYSSFSLHLFIHFIELCPVSASNLIYPNKIWRVTTEIKFIDAVKQ